jgi:hypothetical protein
MNWEENANEIEEFYKKRNAEQKAAEEAALAALTPRRQLKARIQREIEKMRTRRIPRPGQPWTQGYLEANAIRRQVFENIIQKAKENIKEGKKTIRAFHTTAKNPSITGNPNVNDRILRALLTNKNRRGQGTVKNIMKREVEAKKKEADAKKIASLMRRHFPIRADARHPTVRQTLSRPRYRRVNASRAQSDPMIRRSGPLSNYERRNIRRWLAERRGE